MTDESQLQVRPNDADSSLSTSAARSGLIARGRRDAEALIAPVEAESENERYGIAGTSDFLDNNRSTEVVLKDAEKGNAKSQLILAVYYELWSLTGSDGEKAANGAEAAKWHRRAAEQGYAPAQFSLGKDVRQE